jgi:hypothetical protein
LHVRRADREKLLLCGCWVEDDCRRNHQLVGNLLGGRHVPPVDGDLRLSLVLVIGRPAACHLEPGPAQGSSSQLIGIAAW